MKKILCVAISAFMLMGTSFAEFPDVPAEHWGYSAINKMQEAGIITGYEDGSFKPSKNITLAEFSVLFTKIFGIKENKKDNYFVDVPLDHWAKGKIEAIREYINPYYDSIGEAIGVDKYSYMNMILGNVEMTREAFIFATSRIFGYDESNYVEGEEKTLFADYQDILFPKEITLAYKNGIINGEVVDNLVYIRPTRHINRVEASSIFRNLLKYEATKVENKQENGEIEREAENIIKLLNSQDISALKGEIFDTGRILNSEYFSLLSETEKTIKDLLKKYFSNVTCDVKESGFTSYNRGYVKVEINCYDMKEIIMTLASKADELMDTSDLNQIIANAQKEIDEKIKAKEIVKDKKEEMFLFAKQNGAWKLILSEE